MDTSVILYAAQLDGGRFLQLLYGKITLPRAVYNEITHERAPQFLKSWVNENRGWIEVASTTVIDDSKLLLLDAGEREAIALAEHAPGSLLLMDDLDGSKGS